MATFDDPKLALECLEEAGNLGMTQYKTQGGKIVYFVALTPWDWNSLWSSPYCLDIVVLHDGGDFTQEGRKFVMRITGTN